MVKINERLREAARTGSEVKLRALLHEPGCDALAQAKDGMTALMWAACKNHEACLGLLLPASDALAKDKEGMTALMWAACNGYEACVRLLLHASDALARDDNGLTASEWASNNQFESLARFIEAYALTQIERAAIQAQVGSGGPRGRVVRRV